MKNIIFFKSDLLSGLKADQNKFFLKVTIKSQDIKLGNKMHHVYHLNERERMLDLFKRQG